MATGRTTGMWAAYSKGWNYGGEFIIPDSESCQHPASTLQELKLQVFAFVPARPRSFKKQWVATLICTDNNLILLTSSLLVSN